MKELLAHVTSPPSRKIDPIEVSRLTRTARLARKLLDGPDLEGFLAHAMEDLEAERGVILIDRGGPELEPACWNNPRGDAAVYCSLVARQAWQGQDILAAEELEGPCSRTILAVPLRGRERVLGVLYLDRTSSCNWFTHASLAFAIELAGMLSAGLERAERHSRELHEARLSSTDALLAGLAPELNYSLTSMLWCAQHLSGELKHPDHSEVVTSILNDTLRCQTLLTQTVRACRRQPARHREVDLNECVRSVVHEVQPEFARQGTDLRSELEELPAMLGMRDHLVEVIAALVHNAREAVGERPDGRVLVRTSRRLEGIRLQVIDNGPGVTETHALFDPFVTSRRGKLGAGIGLALVRRVVSEHGGSITVHNQSEGGAVFTLELPLAA